MLDRRDKKWSTVKSPVLKIITAKSVVRTYFINFDWFPPALDVVTIPNDAVLEIHAGVHDMYALSEEGHQLQVSEFWYNHPDFTHSDNGVRVPRIILN